ncbi:MAG TPA: GreA/GreB family elongation factor [Phycisphaerales bacterium]|nr:GreA/GreB family elongation factor [Phycisphaerales bacterium]
MTTLPPVDGAPSRASAAGAPSDSERPIVNRLDLERLDRYLGSPENGPATTEYIRWVLENARAVDAREIPRDVVTMHSRVRIGSNHGGDEEYVLCYPGEEESVPCGLSVLSPLGAAMLGVKQGSTFRVIGPRPRTFVLASIEYQPERSRRSST